MRLLHLHWAVVWAKAVLPCADHERWASSNYWQLKFQRWQAGKRKPKWSRLTELLVRMTEDDVDSCLPEHKPLLYTCPLQQLPNSIMWPSWWEWHSVNWDDVKFETLCIIVFCRDSCLAEHQQCIGCVMLWWCCVQHMMLSCCNKLCFTEIIARNYSCRTVTDAQSTAHTVSRKRHLHHEATTRNRSCVRSGNIAVKLHHAMKVNRHQL